MILEGIDESIKKGIEFLVDRQMPSGEFATRRWEKLKVETASYVKSVFITSFVLHSLRYIENLTHVGEISQRAIRFLLNEMEPSGLWRFFGKNSRIHFDVDVACCILASLKEWGVKMNYRSYASLLLKYRNDQGSFYTWILDLNPPFEREDNNIDWVVNANALFFYSLLDYPLPEVEQYLIHIVETGAFQQWSLYYDPPFAFIYCLTRAYADGHNLRLSPAIAKIRDYLLHVKAENKSYGDPLENALAAVGLLNCGCETESTQPIRHLISIQKEDGGWPIGVLHTGGPTGYHTAYGSRELTTAIALEALSKYLKENE